MADESRKGGAGSAASVAYLRASSEDRKPPPQPPAASPATGTGAAARKITFKSADMKEEMRQEVFECARVAFERYTVEKDIAEYIKKEFDKNHGPTWHCIVGRNFGSYVTHETNHFIYFYVDSKAVLLFKSG